MENSNGLKRDNLEQYLPQGHAPLNLLKTSLLLTFQDLYKIYVFSETKWVMGISPNKS